MKGSQTKSDDQFEDKVCEKYKRVDGSVSDLSVLRKPMLTSVTGFNEAMLAFQNGTDEVSVCVLKEENQLLTKKHSFYLASATDGRGM